MLLFDNVYSDLDLSDKDIEDIKETLINGSYKELSNDVLVYNHNSIELEVNIIRKPYTINITNYINR